jgi:DNA-binding MarR family transcriptional regulator
MRPEETLDYYIKFSWLSISRMYNQMASKHNVTQAVGYVLLIIDEEKGTHATKIGPLMGMEPTGLTRLFKSMEKDGLIIRVPDELDKRKVSICLTEKGIEKRKIAKSVVRNFNKKILNEVSEKEFNTFKEVIGKVQLVIDQYKT